MKRKGRLVVTQKVGELNGYTGSGSPYWDWNAKNDKRNTRSKEGENGEYPNANPDVLADDPSNSIWGRGTPPELAELIIERFMDSNGNFPILSKQENLVLKLYTNTGNMDVVCKESKLSRGAVRTYLARIRSKMLRLLKSVDL